MSQPLRTDGLWPVSVQNVTGRREPVVYDNDQRARMLRALLPSPKHNTYVWPHCRTEQEKQ